MLVEFVLLLAGLIAALVIHHRKKFSYFDKRGLKYEKPLPIFGNTGETLIRRKNFFIFFKDIYFKYDTERYIGVYDGFKPIVLVRDPEIIKMITVKDFDHFVDHRQITIENSRDLLNKNLFSMKGDRWRDMRATLSPAFTGSKMRQMLPFINKCAKESTEYLLSECRKNGSIEVEFADAYTRYTNDVIASVAFGYEINSVRDRENKFFVNGGKLTKFTLWAFFKMQIGILFPKLAELLDFTIFNAEAMQFLKSIIANTMKHREENNLYRGDMIDLLIAAKKGTLKHEAQEPQDSAGFATVQESDIGTKSVNVQKWTEQDLAAQAFLFFFAGFDTVSTALCYVTHELGLNPEVQKKLQDEIDEYLGEKDVFTYDDIQKMKYLDMVVSESMRLWAPLAFTDRLCTKSYVLPPTRPGASEYKIEKGDVVFLGVNGLHFDPKYWPEPNKFIPERFSDENKHKIQPFTYLPFGTGPRNCIGSRFALMDVKVMLCHLFKRFDISPCDKTQNPIIFKPKQISMKIDEGYWFKLNERK